MYKFLIRCIVFFFIFFRYCIGCIIVFVMVLLSEFWEGWFGYDVDFVNGKMVWGEYEFKVWEEGDVDIVVIYSSVCGIDFYIFCNDFVSICYGYKGCILKS